VTHQRPEGPAAQGDGLTSVTIAYVADSAHLPIRSAPQAPDGHEGLSERTRSCIEELLSHHGYGGSDDDGSGLVEVVFHELANMWGEEILRGVEEVARRHGVEVVASGFGDDKGRSTPVDDAPGDRPEHFVSVERLASPARERLKARGVPFVVYDPISDLPDDTPFVGATNFRGGHAAVRHLLELGHRRIAMISGPDHLFCVPRKAGYRAALAEAGVAADPELLPWAHLTFEDGHAVARELLSLPDRPTAIFAVTDLQALGVYQAARELGLSIPQDLSVVGFDDLPVAALLDPPLTTVHQPLREMAATATELALALGRGEPVPQIGLEIATTLAVRGSTASPRR
jgi:DNA-binding LacI/PurR family transcriptional regulator